MSKGKTHKQPRTKSAADVIPKPAKKCKGCKSNKDKIDSAAQPKNFYYPFSYYAQNPNLIYPQ